jgi:hypothetical protein
MDGRTESPLTVLAVLAVHFFYPEREPCRKKLHATSVARVSVGRAWSGSRMLTFAVGKHRDEAALTCSHKIQKYMYPQKLKQNPNEKK